MKCHHCQREDKVRLPIRQIFWDPVKQQEVGKPDEAHFLIGYKGSNFLETGIVLSDYAKEILSYSGCGPKQ